MVRPEINEVLVAGVRFDKWFLGSTLTQCLRFESTSMGVVERCAEGCK